MPCAACGMRTGRTTRRSLEFLASRSGCARTRVPREALLWQQLQIRTLGFLDLQLDVRHCTRICSQAHAMQSARLLALQMDGKPRLLTLRAQGERPGGFSLSSDSAAARVCEMIALSHQKWWRASPQEFFAKYMYGRIGLQWAGYAR